MADQRRGVAYGAGAYLLWGLFPLYWPLLRPASALEILAHRVVWSLVVVLAILAVQRRWSWSRWVVRDTRALLGLMVAGLFIGLNWWTYIWGVNHGHVVETSLGYFISPLMSVLLGVFVLHERLRRGQWVAVGVATVAVVVLTVGYGRVPWIALVLAGSFALYGLLKKTAPVGPVEGLTVETAALALPALAWLWLLDSRGESTFTGLGAGHAMLLALGGVVTVVPLLLFGASAQRIPLSVLGLLQYLGPILQFCFGLLVFHEAMPPVRLVGFLLVWSALILFTAESLRNRRRTQRPTPQPVA
jgi:chloramphenicol-sensitive protein RarD